MTGDEQFPEPGPVAEYRDPELVRRFQAEPAPQHGAGFWTDLEARLGAGPADAAGSGDHRGLGAGSVLADEPTDLVTRLDLARTPTDPGRWGSGRWLAVAAATLALLGLGGAVLLSQGRSSSPVESAATGPGPTSDEPDEPEADASSTTSTMAGTTTTVVATSTTVSGATPPDGATDYFDGEVLVDSIGPGAVVAFSPDATAVLVVDDAPGVAMGCEGAELLALYVQDLATGARTLAMGEQSMIETGGLELLVDPFGATPDEVGTRPVYGQEWCDGEPGEQWRGVLASDGRISMLDDLAGTAAADNPFVGRQAGAGAQVVVPSPDGAHLLRLDGSRAEVIEAGADGSVVATLPDDVAGESMSLATWSPDGDAVALSTGEDLVLWSPWTGATQRVDNVSARTLHFDGAGGRLAVATGEGTTILTFGDRPSPVPAPSRCSGRTSFEPLTAEDLTGRSLPPSVAATVLAIDEAAADCGWDALGRLAPDDFVASLGGGDPVEFWRQAEAVGQSPMWYLRTLFRQPHVVDTAEGETYHVWPAIQQDDDCRLDASEKASAIALGLDPTETEEACLVIGGYAGYRTTIDGDGVWRAFLAGE